MTELTTRVSALTPDDVFVSSRDLTPAEQADLDRLRSVLGHTVNRSDPRILSWLWDRNVTDLGGRPSPAGLVEAVGAALGDLLIATVPGTRWMVCPGPGGPMPAVAAEVRPYAPVMPLADVQDRWVDCSRAWLIPYLDRAAAHLVTSVMPTPRPPQDAEQIDEAASASADPSGEVVYRADPRARESDPVVADPVEEVVDGADPRAGETAEAGVADVLAPTVPQPDAAPVAEPVAAPVAEPAQLASPSDAVRDLALVALDHALSALRLGPFDREAFVTIVDAHSTRTVACQDEPAAALRRARETARTSGASRVAIAWIDRHPGGVPGPLQAFPAVLVEASEPGAPGLRVAHRFVDDVLGTGPLGDPQVVGPVASLL